MEVVFRNCGRSEPEKYSVPVSLQENFNVGNEVIGKTVDGNSNYNDKL
ncbi:MULTISPECIES: hypothetical protein [Antarcticibacterium]|nr:MULTISPECIES: hypothetical protein [Antarcticibacterium]